MFNPRTVSFGNTAAIVTSMGLIVGLDAATAKSAAVVGSLLLAGLADNATDSLSVHIYQESERLPERQAFRTTLINFAARFSLSLSFALLFVLLLSYLVARTRSVSAFGEIWKHGAVAVVVILISKAVGVWILKMIGPA